MDPRLRGDDIDARSSQRSVAATRVPRLRGEDFLDCLNPNRTVLEARRGSEALGDVLGLGRRSALAAGVGWGDGDGDEAEGGVRVVVVAQVEVGPGPGWGGFGGWCRVPFGSGRRLGFGSGNGSTLRFFGDGCARWSGLGAEAFEFVEGAASGAFGVVEVADESRALGSDIEEGTGGSGGAIGGVLGVPKRVGDFEKLVAEFGAEFAEVLTGVGGAFGRSAGLSGGFDAGLKVEPGGAGIGVEFVKVVGGGCEVGSAEETSGEPGLGLGPGGLVVESVEEAVPGVGEPVAAFGGALETGERGFQH